MKFLSMPPNLSESDKFQGAFAARVFAALLDLLGLPKKDLAAHKRKVALQKIKKKLKQQTLWDNGVADKIKALGKNHCTYLSTVTLMAGYLPFGNRA